MLARAIIRRRQTRSRKNKAAAKTASVARGIRRLRPPAERVGARARGSCEEVAGDPKEIASLKTDAATGRQVTALLS